MPDRVAFRPSMGFVAMSAVSPMILLGLGMWGFLSAGEFRVVPALLFGLGGILGLVAATDVPIEIVVDEHGVRRRCLLRSQQLAWDDLLALRRAQGGRRRDARRTGESGSDDADRGGLLAETITRKRYLLSSGQERPDTYAGIKELVNRHAAGLSMPDPPFYPKSHDSL